MNLRHLNYESMDLCVSVSVSRPVSMVNCFVGSTLYEVEMRQVFAQDLRTWSVAWEVVKQSGSREIGLYTRLPPTGSG